MGCVSLKTIQFLLKPTFYICLFFTTMHRPKRSSTKKAKPVFSPSAEKDRQILLRRAAGYMRSGQLSTESDPQYWAYMNKAAGKVAKEKKKAQSSKKAKAAKAAKALAKSQKSSRRSATKPHARLTARAIALETPDKVLTPVPEGFTPEGKEDVGTPSLLLNADHFKFSPANAFNNDNAPLEPHSLPPHGSALPGQALHVNVASAAKKVTRGVAGLKLTHLLNKDIDLEKYPMTTIISCM
jgi:hypothetical protein